MDVRAPHADELLARQGELEGRTEEGALADQNRQPPLGRRELDGGGEQGGHLGTLDLVELHAVDEAAGRRRVREP